MHQLVGGEIRRPPAELTHAILRHGNAVVPYTLHMNDIVEYETRYFSTAMYADDLKAEFDALYAEARTRRRMMAVSAHDRIAGRPSRAKVLIT